MDARQAIQAQHYRENAADYDRQYRRENSNHRYKISEIARVLFENLEPRAEGYDILEVGAGTGIHARHFLTEHRRQVRRFVASDISGEMLEQAKARLHEFPVEYLVTPAEQLATKDTFDGIYLSGAMHHFSDPVASIASMKARLRPGGVLVVCEPIVWNPINFVRAVLTGVDWGQFTTTRTNVRRHLIEAGFQLRCDRVLHWKGPSRLATTLWPYQALEKAKGLDTLAIMFLFAARR